MSEQPSKDLVGGNGTLLGDDAGVHRRAMLGLAGLAGVAGMAMLAGKAGAGPLNPPAGPVISTGKTLTEVEPRTAITPSGSSVFTITQSGSYYLTANCPGGIVAAAGVDWVSIDLQGFRVGSPITETAVNLQSTRAATLINGSIEAQRFCVRAVALTISQVVVQFSATIAGSIGVEATVGTISDVAVNPGTASLASFSTGITLNSGIVERCLVQGSSVGIRTIQHTTIRDCVVIGPGVSDPSSAGILADADVVVQHCNVSRYRFGINAQRNLVVENCTVQLSDPPVSTAVGISGQFNIQVRNCNVVDAGVGISINRSFVIDSCVINNCVRAIDAGLEGRIVGCSIDFISSLAILAGDGVSITDCALSRFPAGIRFLSTFGGPPSLTLVGRNTFRPNTGGTLFEGSSQFIGPVLTSTGFPSNTHPFANVRLG